MPLFNYLKQVFQEFGNDKGSQLAAAFAYTGVFALAPFLIVLISIAGTLFGERAAEGRLFVNLSDIVGTNTANTVQHAIAHTHQIGHNFYAFIVGLIISLLAATALTAQLQNSFDTIFGVVPDPRGGIKRAIYIKFKNVVTLVSGSLIVIALIVLNTILSAAGNALSNHLGIPKGTINLTNQLASFGIFIIVLYLIYRVLPDVKLPARVVLWTSLVIGILFLVGKIILGWVIGHNGTASAYGAAASLISILLWFYYTGQLLLLGAEGMKTYADNRSLEYRSKRYTLKQKTSA